jgi:hypothetical protein
MWFQIIRAMNPVKFFQISLLVSFFLGSVVVPKSYGQDQQSAAHIGFIYPLSTNGIKAGEYTNRLSLHAVAGLSYSELGMSLAGFTNVIQNNASGVQVAGFSNIVKNKDTGLTVSGFMNKAGSLEGAQVAGFANIVAHNSKGVQVAGFINTSQDAETQVAGFINVAKKVKGVQIAGFINIADSSDYPIGILNFIKDGEKSISITTDETLTGMVSFRSGGRFLYSIVGLGYNFRSDNKSLYGFEAGFGAHIPVKNSLSINAEATTLTLSDFKSGEYFRSSLRILPSVRLNRHIEVFAGPTFNYVNYSKEKGDGLKSHYLWSETRKSDFHGVYVGITGGIHYIF